MYGLRDAVGLANNNNKKGRAQPQPQRFCEFNRYNTSP